MAEKVNDKVLHIAMVWGFAECGLGGVFHAFKLPFTAFVLGAISLAAMARIAANSSNALRDILQALIWVLSIKFAGSPHSPITAYVAVAFQGVIGAIIFSVGVNKITCMLVGFLIMAESAIQKPLVATLLFGDSLWVAIDAWFNKIVGFFGMKSVEQFSFKLISAYVLLYMFWGLFWGWLNAIFFKLMEEKKIAIERLYHILALRYPHHLNQVKRKNRFRLAIIFLLIIAGMLAFTQSNIAILFRVIFILVAFYVLVLPLFYLVIKRITKLSIITDYFETLPIYQKRLAITLAYAKSKKQMWLSFSTFVFFIQAFMFLPIEKQD